MRRRRRDANPPLLPGDADPLTKAGYSGSE